jgi:hypothetical protein
LKYVLTTPPDRVKYTGLTPTLEELEKIQAYALKLRIFDTKVNMAELLDTSFVPADIAQIDIDTSSVTEGWTPN